MGGARYWGVEREAGEAVYDVYLRKLRYGPPPTSADRKDANNSSESYREKDPDEASSSGGEHTLQWETVRERVIKYGTLPRIVDSLFLPDASVDARQLPVFFATYRAFAEPFDILRTLLALYDDAVEGSRKAASESPAWRQQMRDSIRSVLIFWLETWPGDFDEAPRFPCLTQLVELANHHSPHLKELIPRINKAKARIQEEERKDLNGLGKLLDSVGEGPPRLEELDFLVSPQRAKTPDVARMEPRHVAEQLTYWDAELFRRLVPWQCCGRHWGRRKRGSREAHKVRSVTATVELFNAVSHRLQASILHPIPQSPQRRALIISKWIQVAVELRALKNFASLKTVCAGLQSEPVHRLKSTWALVPSEIVAEFEELARVFGTSYGDEETGENARDVQEAEATAKSPVDSFILASGDHRSRKGSDSTKPRPHRRAKSDMGAHERVGGAGSVPYLGLYLTELTYIDAAMDDLAKASEDDEKPTLINFEKRRKEFQTLAKISLYQKAAQQYNIKPEPKFAAWFTALPTLREKDAYACSLQIQPQTPQPRVASSSSSTSTPDATRKKPGLALHSLLSLSTHYPMHLSQSSFA